VEQNAIQELDAWEHESIGRWETLKSEGHDVNPQIAMTD